MGGIKEYSIFIQRAREYNKNMDIAKAVNIAVDDCIRDNIIRDILEMQKNFFQKL